MSNQNVKKDIDVLIWGASSFAGALVAEYFAKNVDLGDLTWAIGGRDANKLAAIKKNIVEIKSSLEAVEIVIGDNSKQESIDKAIQRARVVLTTVGPYTLYGTTVVDACVRFGTDYCDITGEVPWVRQLIDKYHEQAKEKGVLIVNNCGFDSIPSDLGTLFVVNHIKESHNLDTVSVKSLFGKMKGGASGGTIASIMNLFEGQDAKKVLRDSSNPYLISPPDATRLPGQGDSVLVAYDQDLKKWTAPFIMAACNTRVVRRSSAFLREKGYATNFQYTEVAAFPSFIMAVAMMVGCVIGAILLAVTFTRNLLKKVLPKPGEGPSKHARETGFWSVNIIGTSEKKDGEKPVKVFARVAGRNDPGYNDTAKMLSEAALALATQRKELPLGSGKGTGGVLPPAVALGLPLIQRLKKAGFEYDIQKTEK